MASKVEASNKPWKRWILKTNLLFSIVHLPKVLAADNAAALGLWNCEAWYLNLSEVVILTLLKILFSLCIF